MWRSRQHQAVTANLEKAQLHHVTSEVKLELQFFLGHSKKPRDLDNMIKTFVDLLGGAGLFAPSCGGGKRGVWNTDDHWITAINAEKHEGAENPRTEVVIRMRDGDVEQ